MLNKSIAKEKIRVPARKLDLEAGPPGSQALQTSYEIQEIKR